MLKQGVITINDDFIQTRALSKFFFVQFRPYATSFPGLLLYLTLMPKRRPWRRIWTLRLCSRPPLMQGSMVLFQMWIIWKIGNVILFKRNMTEKGICHGHMFHSLDCIFSFCMDFLHC